MPSTVRGEVRSHINYFSPHPSIAGSLYPLPHESATHPHERHRERARNQSLFLFSSVLPSLQISLSLTRFSLSADFPEFRLRTSLPFPHSSLAPLCPTGNRFFDGVPTAGLADQRDEGVAMFLQRISYRPRIS